ncbi:MAG TPA: hypothetical protein VG733_18305 [Chthoniobacteraceae bacterium]|nr:hypothetical protein [Chthoniobacteraceae bacterium]
MRLRLYPTLFGFAAMLAATAYAQSPYQSSEDFAKYAMKLRESALLKIEPQVFVPTTGRSVVSGRYPWKMRIVATVFWVGEQAAGANPVPNFKSSWDPDWEANYGGFDNPDPSKRRNFIPVAFTPRLNPFYFALPYNDVTHGSTKPEAYQVIPWFKDAFVQPGHSVLQNRWIAIRNHDGKVCYAQWADCGPFRTDHYQYVFGDETPKWNINGGAGLDVSPAVRDFLGMGTKDVVDWKFVEARDIPSGPWARYGENNDFVINARKNADRMAKETEQPSEGPRVITH